MNSLYIVLQLVLEIYGWIVIAYVIVGLLMAFGVVNVYNRAVNIIYEFLTRATEPALRPIRRVLPRMGQIDLSPLVLLLGLMLVRLLLAEYWPRTAMSPA
ncbi:MAG: YggT family protein [Alphaproteobacteria bacterium]